MFKLLFFSENKLNPKALFPIMLAVIAGLAEMILTAVIGMTSEEILEGGSISMKYLPHFVVILTVMLVAKWFSLKSGINLTQDILENIRNKIGNQIRQSELLQIEHVDKDKIYTKMTVDTQNISRASQSGTRCIENLVLLILMIGYMLWLSTIAGITVIGLSIVGVMFYRFQSRILNSLAYESAQKETALFDNFGHVLDGFKELKINHEKNEDLFHNYIAPLALEVKKHRIKLADAYIRIDTFVFVFLFHLLLGYLIFLLPSDLPVSLRVKLVAISVFLWFPIQILYNSIPELFQANVSARRLNELSIQLKSSDKLAESISDPDREILYPFKEIRIQNLCFNYTDKQGQNLFSIGPVNFSINYGEILFLTGGNGGGKSTLMKLITGLYPPFSGEIFIDNRQVDMMEHRYLFSAIYTDCHLFDKLYGIKINNNQKINEFIKLMNLEHKVQWENNRFSYSELSTGQTKRLAFIVSLLDDRPVYVFDEWASEQDPVFKKKFYRELLPYLKSNGKTIIAATHDDLFFDAADRILKMESGQIV